MYFAKKDLHKNWKRTLSVLGYWFVCTFWMCISQVRLQQALSSAGGLAFLGEVYDIGFDFLPQTNDFPISSDMSVVMLSVITIARMFLLPRGKTYVFRRTMFFVGTLYGFRGFTIVGTVLPNPYPHCAVIKADTIINSLIAAFKVMSGMVSTCADCLYSGHSCILIIAGMMWQTYTDNPYLKVLAWFASIGGCILLITNHYHYTDDVLFGVILTVALHVVYFWGLHILHSNFAEKLPVGGISNSGSTTAVVGEVIVNGNANIACFPFFKVLQIIAWVEEIELKLPLPPLPKLSELIVEK